LPEDKQDLPKPAPDNNNEVTFRLPERRARKGFTAMLAQIAEELKFNKADKSIGNYEFPDLEWESWNVGPDEYKDEYEVGPRSDSDHLNNAQSVAMTTTSTRFTKSPLSGGQHASISKLSKLQTGKMKVTGGLKRKHQDVNSDGETEPDSTKSEVKCEETYDWYFFIFLPCITYC
jgi:hypothetical protein